MNIGVPKEAAHENRVGLSPDGAALLAARGHQVYVQSRAGAASRFSDEDYRAAGSQIVYSAEEVWGRADIVAKVQAPRTDEFSLLHEGLIVCGFLHLAVAPHPLIETLLREQITAVAYETIQDDAGRLPVVIPMSEIAGRMIPSIAGQLLMNTQGGRGILLGGLPGIPSAEVIIIGGGVVGTNAAKSLVALGAQVTILDQDPARLREIDEHLGGRVTLMLATAANLDKVCRYADVLVGAILIPGERAPRPITRQMVRTMKARSVVMDISIDQGGCIETSRPTTIDNPTYIEEDVIHYCVPNMSSMIARTASQALTYGVLPYLSRMAAEGLAHAASVDRSLARGVMLAGGYAINPVVASVAGVEAHDIAEILPAAQS